MPWFHCAALPRTSITARNAHPEITRRRILDAAQKLFSEKGFEHTSMQDIVNELGNLSKGAIYHHFPGKEAILERTATLQPATTYSTSYANAPT